MRIHPFRAIYPDMGKAPADTGFFDTVKAYFPEYVKAGYYLADEEEAVFVYDIEYEQRVQSGLVFNVDVQDYLDGRIRRHEHTLFERESKMKQLFLERNALIKPVLVAYPRDKKVNKLMERARDHVPFLDIQMTETERHVIYKVTDKKDISRLQKRFRKNVPRAYIADGHHRCITSAKLYEEFSEREPGKDFSKILCMFMQDEELIIHDYNRVVDVLDAFSPTLFMAKMSHLCNITPLPRAAKPSGKYEMTMYILKEWYLLKWKKSVLKRYKDEDVIFDGAILNREVLGGIFGIEDVRNDSRLKYVEGISGIEGIVRKAEKSIFRIAFCLYPVQMEELEKVADKHKTLPPKSTWFEPRIKNGVLCAPFDK
jgi:uncharacterized protein (DUF1015 family)